MTALTLGDDTVSLYRRIAQAIPEAIATVVPPGETDWHRWEGARDSIEYTYTRAPSNPQGVPLVGAQLNLTGGHSIKVRYFVESNNFDVSAKMARVLSPFYDTDFADFYKLYSTDGREYRKHDPLLPCAVSLCRAYARTFLLMITAHQCAAERVSGNNQKVLP
jgi:hypothetical protein